MVNTYKSGSHSKYLLQYHLIFVCKYRKKLLTGKNVIGDVKRLSAEYVERHNTIIHYMEVDKDHIHYMIETTPNINLSRLVRNMNLPFMVPQPMYLASMVVFIYGSCLHLWCLLTYVAATAATYVLQSMSPVPSAHTKNSPCGAVWFFNTDGLAL